MNNDLMGVEPQTRGNNFRRNALHAQRSQKPRRWNACEQHVAKFEGMSPKMQGKVFQVNGEQRKQGQFKNTLDQLKIYASENFPKDVKKMDCLFGSKITKPMVKLPDEPKKENGKSELTRAQEKIFKARINLFIKEEKSLNDSLTALYNVAWGQCSVMMQDRLESSKRFKVFDANSDVAALLNKI